MGAGVGLRDRWPTWTLGGRPLRAAMIVGALCGLVAALTEGPWGAAILAATLAAVVAGLLRPSALLTLIAIAVVAVPSYVGWLVPGGLFFNMARGVIYGAAVGLILWTMAEARNELPWPKGDALSPMSRIAILSLTLGWTLAPLIGLAHGGGNAFRAFNAVLYQALPLWVGLRFASEYGRRRTLQVVLALLILYTVPYWLYELEFAKSAFKSYVPPIPGLLGAEELLMRGGNVRVQATFGHPPVSVAPRWRRIRSPPPAAWLVSRRRGRYGRVGDAVEESVDRAVRWRGRHRCIPTAPTGLDSGHQRGLRPGVQSARGRTGIPRYRCAGEATCCGKVLSEKRNRVLGCQSGIPNH